MYGVQPLHKTSVIDGLSCLYISKGEAGTPEEYLQLKNTGCYGARRDGVIIAAVGFRVFQAIELCQIGFLLGEPRGLKAAYDCVRGDLMRKFGCRQLELRAHEGDLDTHVFCRDVLQLKCRRVDGDEYVFLLSQEKAL